MLFLSLPSFSIIPFFGLVLRPHRTLEAASIGFVRLHAIIMNERIERRIHMTDWWLLLCSSVVFSTSFNPFLRSTFVLDVLFPEKQL
jgi:hypothetical protein